MTPLRPEKWRKKPSAMMEEVMRTIHALFVGYGLSREQALSVINNLIKKYSVKKVSKRK